MTDRADLVLIDRVLGDIASPEEVADFEARVMNDATFARDILIQGALFQDLQSRFDVHKHPSSRASTRCVEREGGSILSPRFGWGWRIAAMVAVATLIGIGALVASNLTGGETDSKISYEPVATLVWADAQVIGDEPLMTGESVRPQTIRTQGGETEFVMASGANVSAMSPAEIRFVSPLNLAMLSGVVEFACPPEAKNFTVHLPGGANVVDLGTRFRIIVDPRTQNSRIRVQTGRVRIDYPGPDGGVLFSEELTAGDVSLVGVDENGISYQRRVRTGESREDAEVRFGKPVVFATTVALDTPVTTYPAAVLIQAVNFGAPGQTVNTGTQILHFVEGPVSSDSATGAATGLFQSGAESRAALFTGDSGDVGLNAVLRSHGWAKEGAASRPQTLRIGGLTPGQAYVVQLITSDMRPSSVGRIQRFHDTASFTGNQSESFPVQLPTYVLVEFTAAADGIQDIIVGDMRGLTTEWDSTLAGFTLYAIPQDGASSTESATRSYRVEARPDTDRAPVPEAIHSPGHY